MLSQRQTIGGVQRAARLLDRIQGRNLGRLQREELASRMGQTAQFYVRPPTSEAAPGPNSLASGER